MAAGKAQGTGSEVTTVEFGLWRSCTGNSLRTPDDPCHSAHAPASVGAATLKNFTKAMSSSAHHLEVRLPEAQLPGSAYSPSGASSEDPSYSAAAAASAPQAEAAILLASLTKEQRAVLAKLDKVRQ